MQGADGFRGSAFKRFNLQVIEVGVGIGFRPKTHSSRLGEGLVVRVNYGLPIPEDGEVAALRFNSQFMPNTTGHWAIPTGKLLAVAVDDLVEPDIAFQGVRSRDVIVVLIVLPKENPGGDCPSGSVSKSQWMGWGGVPSANAGRAASVSSAVTRSKIGDLERAKILGFRNNGQP